ncbi:hypothetical protein [Bradyrhizobium sp.]|uniref:hypothetical protein n=1 Tax=Bradyrhizobium sp. TaxID=376 RepID=UPI0040381E7A
MTDEEFRNWLSSEVAKNRMTDKQMSDLLQQKVLFDQEIGSGESPARQEYRLQIVGYVAERRRVSNSIHKLLRRAKEEFPGRMVYFEPIGFDLF